jgi:hypothetical protein
MKDYKSLLTSFVEVVTFLLASFGGFLKNIAPPDQVGASYPVGIMSFLLLIVLLAISAMARNVPKQTSANRWMAAGSVFFFVALPVAFLYPYLLSAHTYPHQTELSQRRISGSDIHLTADARQYKLANPNATVEDLAQNLPDGDIWTREGIERTSLLLLATYVTLVLALAGAIFCLLEANLRGQGGEKVPAEKASATVETQKSP